MKLISLLVTGIVLIGCGRTRDVEYKPLAETRTLLVYGYDTINYERFELKKKIDYHLLIIENDSAKEFQYIDPQDSLRPFTFRFKKRNRRLRWGPLEYVILDTSEFIINGKPEKFHLYGFERPIVDVYSRVYFNDNYGVINFGDSRNEFIYLGSANENTVEVLLDVLRSLYVDTQDNKKSN